MTPIRCIGFSEALARNSRASPRLKWPSPLYPVLQIWCPKQRALSSSKNHWSLLSCPLQRLLPLTATPKNRISETIPLGTLKVALVATAEGRDASLVDAPRIVRYAMWKATMRIDVGNGMIAMVMPLKLSSPKPSLHPVPSLAMRPQIGI
jgi:hypothetical protein